MRIRTIFPQTPPPGVYPDSMNDHLKSVWCTTRNAIQDDQQAIVRAKAQIKSLKANMKFFNERITANQKALAAIEGVK